jgi:hypothetical protein
MPMSVPLNNHSWHSAHHFQVPKSVCSRSCLPGFSQTPKQGVPHCCFDCSPCPKGQFADKTGEGRGTGIQQAIRVLGASQFPSSESRHSLQLSVDFGWACRWGYYSYKLFGVNVLMNYIKCISAWIINVPLDEFSLSEHSQVPKPWSKAEYELPQEGPYTPPGHCILLTPQITTVLTSTGINRFCFLTSYKQNCMVSVFLCVSFSLYIILWYSS